MKRLLAIAQLPSSSFGIRGLRRRNHAFLGLRQPDTQPNPIPNSSFRAQ
jgi:hypothetical protein